jgi:hypothetical protein
MTRNAAAHPFAPETLSNRKRYGDQSAQSDVAVPALELYWGNGTLRYVKLNSDMTELLGDQGTDRHRDSESVRASRGGNNCLLVWAQD